MAKTVCVTVVVHCHVDQPLTCGSRTDAWGMTAQRPGNARSIAEVLVFHHGHRWDHRIPIKGWIAVTVLDCACNGWQVGKWKCRTMGFGDLVGFQQMVFVLSPPNLWLLTSLSVKIEDHSLIDQERRRFSLSNYLDQLAESLVGQIDELIVCCLDTQNMGLNRWGIPT